MFEIAKDRGLLLDVWGGRIYQGALQRIGHALAARRDRVFGGRKLVHAGRDGVTRNAAYRLEVPPPRTPETPETPGDKAKTSLETGDDERDLSGCFTDPLSETPGDPGKTPDDTSTVLNGINGHESTVSGVSGVSARPATRDDDLAHLVGATEGEL